MRQAQIARQQLGPTRLVVLTHSSFRSATGPGPRLKQIFEGRCQCQVQFISTGSGHLLLHRLQLKAKEPIDVVIGLDPLSLPQAFEKIKWKSIDYPRQYLHPQVQAHTTPHFLAYNYSPLSLISRHPTPSSWAEIWRRQPSISLQDPRTSSLGLQFVFWMYAINRARPLVGLEASQEGPTHDTAHPHPTINPGPATEPGSTTEPGHQDIMLHFIKKLNIHSLSPSWSTAYALFRTGQSDMSFSYLSSLVYHWQQGQYEYKAVQFGPPKPTSAARSRPSSASPASSSPSSAIEAAGQPTEPAALYPLQIEFLAMPEKCFNCKLAKKWAYFMLSREGQKIIMQHNYMFPARAGLIEGTLFEKLPTLPTLPPQLWQQFLQQAPQHIQTLYKGLQ